MTAAFPLTSGCSGTGGSAPSGLAVASAPTPARPPALRTQARTWPARGHAPPRRPAPAGCSAPRRLLRRPPPSPGPMARLPRQ